MVTEVDHQGMSTSRDNVYVHLTPKVNRVKSQILFFKFEITSSSVELEPWLCGRCLEDQALSISMKYSSYGSRKNIFTPFRPYNME